MALFRKDEVEALDFMFLSCCAVPLNFFAVPFHFFSPVP